MEGSFHELRLRGLLLSSSCVVSWGTLLRPRCIAASVDLVQACVRWEEDLPPGYRVEEDPDVLLLLRPDGSKAAAFSAQGADPLEVIATAWEDYE